MCAAKKEFIIALDEGTTNAKAVALDAQGGGRQIFSTAGHSDSA